MIEDQWLTCTNIDEMLNNVPSTASSRKLMLFGCACCRHLWPLLVDGRSQRSVEAAEQGADGIVTREKVEAAWQEANEALNSVWGNCRIVSVELLAHGAAAETAMRASEAVIKTGEETLDLLYHVGDVALLTRDSRCINDPVSAVHAQGEGRAFRLQGEALVPVHGRAAIRQTLQLHGRGDPIQGQVLLFPQHVQRH